MALTGSMCVCVSLCYIASVGWSSRCQWCVLGSMVEVKDLVSHVGVMVGVIVRGRESPHKDRQIEREVCS